jgi:adenosine kinase
LQSHIVHASPQSLQPVALNISAPFIAQFFKVQLETIMPYADYIICNESEAEAWGGAAGLPEPTDHASVARSIALLPKNNPSRPRIVIITRGSESTIYVSSAAPDTPKILPITKLADDEIVDTNGAGDAFAGGFMGGLVLGKSLDESVEIGHKMGAMNIGQVSLNLLNYKILNGLTGWTTTQMAEGANCLRL